MTISIASNTEKLLEAWGETVGRDPDGSAVASGFAGGWLTARYGWHTSHYDRAEGRFIPVYENEVDLRAIRMATRLMDSLVPSAQAARNRLTDYTISKGFDWTVQHSSPELQSWCKAVLKRFYDDCNFLEIERESFRAEIVDGEYLAQLVAEDGQISLQTCQPEWLTEPINTGDLDRWLQLPFDPTWSFGVLRRRYRDRNYGYHISRDQSGRDWDFVPCKRFVHWTRNVPREAKRGYPDGYVTHAYLQHGDKVAKNTAIGTAIQAAIAFIVEHATGTTSTQVQNLVAGLNNQVVKPDYSGRPVSSSISDAPGKRLDVRQGQKYTNGPLGSANTQIYIEVMEAMFRLSGTVYAFPEHMMTGSAENNNMASSMVAESPFVQGRMADQRIRCGRLEKLFYSVIELACEVTGRDFSEVQQGLEIGVSEPSIVTRDPKAMTEALAAQADRGWVDDKTAIQTLGYDYDTIKQALAAQHEEQGSVMGAGASQATMGSISRQQWKRNAAAVMDIRKAIASGEYTASHAKVLLTSLGFSGKQALEILSDATPETPPELADDPAGAPGALPEKPQAKIAGKSKLPAKRLPEQISRTQRRLLQDWAEYP